VQEQKKSFRNFAEIRVRHPRMICCVGALRLGSSSEETVLIFLVFGSPAGVAKPLVPTAA
jgi:hypothetical protein